MRMRLIVKSAAVAVALFLTASAYGDAIFTLGNHHVAGEENILFHNPDTGATIMGQTNTSHTTIDFTSSTNMLHSSGGQADIDGFPKGTLINDITMTAPGFSFTHVIFDPFKPAADNNLTVLVVTNTGTFTFPPPPATGYGSTHGQNFLTVNAGTGEVLLGVTINSSQGFQSVGQWRIAGIAPFIPVPEPSSMLLLGSGLLVLTQVLRRRLLKGRNA